MRRPTSLPLRWQISLAAAAVALVTLSVMVIALYLSERNQIKGLLRERLIATAYGASTAANGDSLVALSRTDRVTPAWIDAQTLTRLFLRDSTGYAEGKTWLTLVALDGDSARAVADSRWNIGQPRQRNASWILPPGLSDSLGNVVAGRNPVYWFELNDHYTAIAPIYRYATIPAGVAVASALRGAVGQELLERLLSLAVFPLLALASALGLAFYLSGRLTRRVTALADHARAITAGDLLHDVTVKAGDEVGALADALQHMTVRLRDILREAEASARNEAIGRLAGVVAHDFNNALTVVRGTAELIRERLPKNHEVQDDLTEITAAADRAAELTSQLLVFSRERVRPKAVIDLNDTIDRSAGMLNRLAGPNVVMTTELAPQKLAISIEPGQFDRVLVNLVINARDSMPNGGTLKVRTRAIVVDATSPSPADAKLGPGGYAMLLVSDTGTGMTEEVRRRAFEPFFSTKAPARGTGLGLASARAIIQKCGGEITIESTLGRGSTFTIFLPLAVAGEVSVSPPQAGTTAPKGSATVLLVEDEDMVRAVAQRILEKRGYRVLSARHAEEALAMERRLDDRMDLLLTDIMMPGIDGVELAAVLRERRPDLRVLFMSGFADQSVFSRDDVAEDSDLLHKPFTVESLTKAVRVALEDRRDLASAAQR